MKKMITLVMSSLFVTAICAAQTQTSGNAAFRQEGIASWYGAEFEGRPTASGELFDPNQFTAAHPDLPFGTLLIVTNVINGEQVVVRVNDRGPFVRSRIIDVSKAAAEKLNMLESGTAQVFIELAPKNTVSPAAANISPTSTGTPSGTSYTSAADAQTRTSSAPVQTAEAQTRTSSTPVQTPDVPAVQANQPVSPEVVTAAPPPAAAAQPQQLPSRTTPPVTGQTTPRPLISSNSGAPAYTPQQPALTSRQAAAQTSPTVTSQQSPVPSAQARTQASTQTRSQAAAPSGQARTQPSTTQTRSQTLSPPVASFQPIPTTSKPPIPANTVQPAMPSSAMSAALPQTQTAAPIQPSRSWPSYASAEISGGPFVKGRYYRLQIGSFKVAKNAVEVFDRLSAAGLNPQWEPFGDLYRVVISNVRADDINSIAIRLGGAGFKEAIAREER